MAKLCCRPGDLAIVTHSCNPALLGHIVIVRAYNHGASRWEVEDMGSPVLGTGFDTGFPILTRDWLFTDSSLQPLRGGEVVQKMLREMDHA